MKKNSITLFFNDKKTITNDDVKMFSKHQANFILAVTCVAKTREQLCQEEKTKCI